MHARVDAFRKALDSGKPSEPLVLDSDDINVLIADNPDLQDKVHVDIEGDKVNGQVSFPLEGIGLPAFKGRYLNGKATLKVSLEDGFLARDARRPRSEGEARPRDLHRPASHQEPGRRCEPQPAECRGDPETREHPGHRRQGHPQGTGEDDDETKEGNGAEDDAKAKDDAIPDAKAKAKDEAEPTTAPSAMRTPKRGNSRTNEVPRPG